MKKTLVLFAHPYYEKSVANSFLIKAYQNQEHITFLDLYEKFPDFQILANRERKKFLENNYDSIIFHMPLIWFGMPPLLKLWIDEVFDPDWINKNTKSPISGKKGHIIVTAGGTKHSFSEQGPFMINAQKYLSSLTETLQVNGMILENFITIYNADKINPEELDFYFQKIKAIVT